MLKLIMLMKEDSPESKMNMLFYVVVGSMLLIYLFRAAIGYRRYKSSIFPQVYDNYLFDYFYKVNVTQDPSRSNRLKKTLGYHRIVYAQIANKEGKLVSQVMTIIHTKGILSIAYLNLKGRLSGLESGEWIIRRTEEGNEKKFKIENPLTYLREYVKHLGEVLEGRNVESAIALNDDCDFSDVHIKEKVLAYKDVPQLIASADCGYGLNNEEIDEIYKKLGGK